jgi:transcriptional regulator with XRE-family HTH domain
MGSVPKPSRQRQRHFLAEWREFCNLTQEAAADRLGVSQSKLSRVERGKIPYDQDFLEEAAKAYGTSASSLIIRNPFDGGSIWSLQERLAKADPMQRRKALEIVETFLRDGTDG